MAEPNTRRLRYMDRYARTMSNYYAGERIRQEIEDEQQRIQYLDSLIAQERQTITALKQNLPGQYTDLGEATRLVQSQIDALGAAGAATALQSALTKQATTLSRADAEAIAALKGADSSTAYRGIEKLMRKKPGAADKVLAAAQTELSDELSDKAMSDLAAEAAEQARKFAAPGVPAGATAAAARAREDYQEALEAAYFAGPSGIVGGSVGLGQSKLRQNTAAELRAQKLEDRAKALEESDYTTEQEALDAALEVVRATGDPREIQDPLAREVYNRTLTERSYRNDQRADFDSEILEAIRKRVRLEAERESLAGAYSDPRKEAAIRQLRAQGYKVEDTMVRDAEGNFVRNPNSWKNAYVMYQGTPMYDYLIGAKERMDKAIREDAILEPKSRAQQVAIRYTAMRRNRGEKTDLNDLAAELEKAGFKGAEVTDAVQFTAAYWNLGGEAQSAETMKSLREQKEIVAKEREYREQVYTDKAKEVERQDALIRREMAQIDRGESARQRRLAREERAASRAEARDRSKRYTALRAMGMTEKEAREMAGFVAQPQQLPGAPEAEPTLDRARHYRELRDQGLSAQEAREIAGGPRLPEPPLNAETIELPEWVREMEPKPGDVGYEFKDRSDPRSPTYRRTRSGFEVLDDKGEVTATIPATNNFAFSALEFAEVGDLGGIDRVKKAKEEALKKKPPQTELNYNPETGEFE